MNELHGKGVWLQYSGDVNLAIEMAVAIGATHVLYKTGQGGMFFVESARQVNDRLRKAGLIPLAWLAFSSDDPLAQASVAVKSARLGYEGLVFVMTEQAGGRGVAAGALGHRLLEEGLDPQRLYYASYPNIWQRKDIPYREMNRFCHGGFMPLCFPAFQRTARTVIHRWAYGEHARWSQEWGDMPPLYPVLTACRDESGSQPLTAPEMLEWAEAVAEHEPPFFSIHRADTTPRELWPILAAMGERKPARPPVGASAPSAPPPAVPVEPPAPAAGAPEAKRGSAPAVYHVVTVNDTVWSLCQRHNLPPEQFWEWNGHLWEEHGMPRDAVYLQEGWRVRVG